MMIIRFALWGGFIGFTLTVLATTSSKMGHGTYIPFWLFFAPLGILSRDITMWGGGVHLYIAYAILLALGNQRRKRINVLFVLLLFHFGMVGLSVYLFQCKWDWGPKNHIWKQDWHLIASCFVTFLLIILASFYVVLKPPGNQTKATKVETKRCEICRYNLTGNVSGICPECGTPIQDETDARVSSI